MVDFRAIIAVGAGAALGGVARLLVATWFTQRFGTAFPWGTLVINVSGSLLIGIVLELSQSRVGLPPTARLFLATGILGGYTTFSTFSFETLSLWADGFTFLGFAYAAGSVVLGVGAAFLGVAAVRAVFP